MNHFLCVTVVLISMFGLTRQGIAELHPGDTALVVKPNAKLKVGERIVAELRKGHEVMVTGAKGDWIGCRLTLETAAGREEVSGWLKKDELVHASGPGTAAGPRLAVPPANVKSRDLADQTQNGITSHALPWHNLVVNSLGPPCRRRNDGVVLLEAEQLNKIHKIPRIEEIEELHVGIFYAPDEDEETQAAFAALGVLKNLKRLTFLGPFADENLESLRGLMRLELLQLQSASPKFTGAGLKYLKDLPNLRALGLSGAPQIQESALQSILGFSKLETLALDSQWLTLATIDDLRQALPDCRVFSCALEVPPRVPQVNAVSPPPYAGHLSERPVESDRPRPPDAKMPVGDDPFGSVFGERPEDPDRPTAPPPPPPAPAPEMPSTDPFSERPEDSERP